MCLWKHLLPQLWCHVMVLVDMTRVFRQRSGLIMHSRISHLQVLTQRELRKKLEIVQKEKDGIQLNVDKFEPASKSLNKLIECQIVDNCKKGLGYENYNVVPPPYTGNFMPPTPDLSYTGLDEFVNKPVVSKSKDGNMSYLTYYEKIDGGYVAFRGNPKGGKITGKGTQSNGFAGTKASDNAGQARKEIKHVKDYILLPLWTGDPPFSQDSKSSHDDGFKTSSDDGKKVDEDPRKDSEYDYSRFTWVFFLATKDKTSGILKSFITEIENLVDHKVNVIRCDNETELKNREMNQFCEMKGILRQFSIARTPQQNGVAERRNKTLIEAARTMLADSKLPSTFWAEAVNTACYVQNRVCHFGCPVTILTYHRFTLRQFYGIRLIEGFFVGYSLNSKAFRVFNSKTRIVEENLHIRFSESTPNVVGSGPDWLFDIDALTRTMNYEPIVAGAQSNGFVGTKASDNAGQARKETEPVKDYILLPLWTTDPPYSQDPKSSHDDGSKPSSDDGKKIDEDPRKDSECKDQEKEDNINSTNNVNTAGNVNTVSSTVNATGINKGNVVGGKTSIELPFDLNMPALEDYNIFDFSRDDEDDGAVADMNNLDTTIQVSPNPTIRIHKDHPLNQVIEDLQSATQTRKMSKNLDEHGFEEPKKVIHALKDPSWIEAMQEELLQFKSLPLLQELNTKSGLFLAYDSFKDFVVYQMDVKSAFLYGKIKKEVYVCQPPGFEDLYFPDRVYKVEKALYGLHQAPRAWYETFSTYMLDNRFQRGKIDKTLFIKRHKGDILLVLVYVDDIIFGSTKMELCIAFEKLMHEKFQMSSMGELTFFLGIQVRQKTDGIFISQDKYVAEILKKFGFTEVKTVSTPMETQKPLLKDEDGEEVDVHMYRLPIVNPKVSLLHAVKRILAYTNSDYAGASLDRKSTTGGCQFLRCRLISWQCKKQTVVANFTTEAEYIA
ncbi:uncharacterized mitochondrial protein-like protein [Tanacetum coccineum]